MMARATNTSGIPIQIRILLKEGEANEQSAENEKEIKHDKANANKESDLSPSSGFPGSSFSSCCISCPETGFYIGCIHNTYNTKRQAAKKCNKNGLNQPGFWWELGGRGVFHENKI
jgi:hypothetical protein